MTILLFGITRDIVGQGELSLSGPGASDLRTVGDLKSHLIERYPELNKLSSLAIAVNQSYAEDKDPVGESDEIALIPPVSGG
jgi:molybdopterin synthase sulfur carrier subunit